MQPCSGKTGKLEGRSARVRYLSVTPTFLSPGRLAGCQANKSDDKRCRPDWVKGSFAPQASKNSTSCFLAASPFVRATWVKGWDENGRPITTENWRANPEGTTVYPALGGGSNFQAPSYSPLTSWMYFAYNDSPGRYSIGPAPFEEGKQFQGRGNGGGFGPPANDGQAPPSSGVMAFNPETMKVEWKFELTQNSLSAGVMATAGGVVFAASGEGNFIALDAKTGKTLWSFGAGAGLSSSPMSYSVDGRQYVSISSNNVLYTFGLP